MLAKFSMYSFILFSDGIKSVIYTLESFNAASFFCMTHLYFTVEAPAFSASLNILFGVFLGVEKSNLLFGQKNKKKNKKGEEKLISQEYIK